MNSNEKGNVGLAKIISVLTEKGYNCFLPFTDTTCIDLIVANNEMKTIRVQVKYRKKKQNGVLEIPFESVVNAKRVLVDRSKIDYYMVYCPDNDKTYFIDLKQISNVKTFSLRIDPIKNSQPNVRYASEFEEFNF
jgi:hypothetical protein